MKPFHSQGKRPTLQARSTSVISSLCKPLTRTLSPSSCSFSSTEPLSTRLPLCSSSRFFSRSSSTSSLSAFWSRFAHHHCTASSFSSPLRCSTRGTFSSAWKAITTPFTTSEEATVLKEGKEVAGKRGGPHHLSSSSSSTDTTTVTPPTLSFLASPTTLLDSVEDTIRISRDLLHRITTATDAQEKHDLIDTTSNVLCLLLDPCEFVRQIHPDDQYKQNASEAFQRGYAFMSEANSRRDLYDVICSLDSPEGHAKLNEESVKNAVQLRRDMESNGIHLHEQERNRVTEMNIHKEDLSMQLLTQAPCSREFYQTLQDLLRERYELAQLLGFESFSQQQLRGTMIEKPENVWSFLCGMDEKYRPEVEREFQLVERYAAGTGKGSSSGSVSHLCGGRRQRSAITDDQRAQIVSVLRSKEEPNGANEYFSVANCIRGIQCLCSEVFGVRLEQVPFDFDAEMYQPYAKKYHVYQNTEEESTNSPLGKNNSSSSSSTASRTTGTGSGGKGAFLGVIVLDLYQSDKKYCQAGHLTIQLGCRPHQNVISKVKALAGRLPERQYPIVALTCNIPPVLKKNHSSRSKKYSSSSSSGGGKESLDGPMADDESTLMDPHSVKTLFHEFGHAMHTIFGQTTVQNLAGTRSSIDFVETFSQLFELFLTSHDFLRLWATHVREKHPISKDLVEHLNRAGSIFTHLDQQDQIILSAVDQVLHGPQPLRVYCVPSPADSVTSSPSGVAVKPLLTRVTLGEKGDFRNSTTFQLQDSLIEIVKPFTVGTPTRSSVLGTLSTEHLVGYPGGYYGYLYSLTVARRIWSTKFKKNPLNRAAGKELVDQVMSLGAACNAKVTMEKYLNIPFTDIEVWG